MSYARSDENINGGAALAEGIMRTVSCWQPSHWLRCERVQLEILAFCFSGRMLSEVMFCERLLCLLCLKDDKLMLTLHLSSVVQLIFTGQGHEKKWRFIIYKTHGFFSYGFIIKQMCSSVSSLYKETLTFIVVTVELASKLPIMGCSVRMRVTWLLQFPNYKAITKDLFCHQILNNYKWMTLKTHVTNDLVLRIQFMLLFQISVVLWSLTHKMLLLKAQNLIVTEINPSR